MKEKRPLRDLPNSGDHGRLVYVALALFTLFALLTAQFYRIQIVQESKWVAAAARQHQMVIKEPFQRGRFFSNTTVRQGHPEEPQPFVIDVPKFHLYIDPKALPEALRGEMIERISHILTDKEEVAKLPTHFMRASRSRKLASWLDPDSKSELLQWWQPFAKKHKLPRNALFFVQDYKRSYPFGKMLGQLLQTVRDDKDEKGGHIPTGGLELVLNKYLRGSIGKRLIMRSPRHPLDTGEITLAPVDGADVYLTINHHIQAIAEAEIEKAVKRSGAKGGFALMLDPYTGEVLALAQYPFFDPRDYKRYFSDPTLLETTSVKAVTDAFEPGSTMKPLVLASILQANLEDVKAGKKSFFDPEEKVPTSTGNVRGVRKPIKDLRHYRYMNMNMGIQKSGNIYVTKAVEKLLLAHTNEEYKELLERLFCFGKRSGVELPSESPGMLPTPGKMHPNGALEWSSLTPYTLALGHNLQVNGVQLARAYCAIANGGKMVSPTLVRKIVKKERDGSVQVLLDNTTEERVKSFPQVLDPSVAARVLAAMKFVTKTGGTAAGADIDGYTEAGKSGTAEKVIGGRYSKDIHFSDFVGIAPASNPRFVLVVGIDEPEKRYIPGVGKVHHGGKCTAPVFREIATQTLDYLGLPPDDPYGYPANDPRRVAAKADYAKEIKELEELYHKWND